jgi:hypothetical protein
VTWAIDGATFDTDILFGFLGDGIRQNNYSLKKAHEYFIAGISAETADERRQEQASMFVALGHVVHLLQDLHSTAHTRNDAHADGDVFERFGRAKAGGFNFFTKSTLNSKNDKDIMSKVSAVTSIKYPTYRAFLEDEAMSVSTNFFSMDTICLSPKSADFLESEERSPDDDKGIWKADKLDGLVCRWSYQPEGGFSHPKPRTSGVQLWDDKHKQQLFKFPMDENMIESYWDKIEDQIKDNPGRFTYSLGADHLLAKLRWDKVHEGRDTIRTPDDESVLKQNGLTLFADSVASSEGFIDYFFRGRIDVIQLTKKDVENTQIAAGVYVFNVSDSATVYSSEQVIFRSGQVSLWIDNNSEERKLLLNASLDKDLAPCTLRKGYCYRHREVEYLRLFVHPDRRHPAPSAIVRLLFYRC